MGIQVESTIIIEETGHRRIHRIVSDYDGIAYDAGFAMQIGDTSCRVDCIQGEGEVVLVRADANTNLLYTKTEIPMVKYQIYKGENFIETKVIY